MVNDPNTRLAALLRGVGRGSEQDFQEFHTRTRSLMEGAARRILRDPDSSQDAVQETLIQVWKNSHRFDPARGTVEAWLLTMARSRALDALRRRREIEQLEQEPDQVSSGPGPEAVSRRSELRGQLMAALRTLGASQRTLIERAFLEGRSHRQLAREHGVPLGTVKTRIRRGLIQLRKHLAPLRSSLGTT